MTNEDEVKHIMDEEDAAFEAAARAIDEESEAGQYGSGNSNGSLEEYQKIAYVSLITKKPIIIRAIGDAPIPIASFKEGMDPTIAIEAFTCEIVGKEKKTCKLILPDRAKGGTEHPLWRLVDTVLAYDVVDGKRVYRFQNTHPALFKSVFNGGFDDARKAQYSKGLRGQKIIIQNVIDRLDPEWHKKNKATKLLAKSCWPIQSKPGTFGYQLGIPSFGYMSSWSELWKAYHKWDRYDVAITKTGMTSPPIVLKNASKFKEAGIPEIPADLLPFVVVGPLTEEERNYEKVEIAKLFAVSTYGKILSRIPGLLQETDKAFGTHFFEEIKEKSSEEKKKNPQHAEFDAEGSTASDAATKTQVQGATFTAAQVAQGEVAQPTTATRRVVAPAAPSAINTKLLKGWDDLTQEEKDCIVKTYEMDGALQSIEYKPSPNHADSTLLDCNICGGLSYDFFKVCPQCGSHFSFTDE